MPIYEYVCADCQTLFSRLRPMSQADAPVMCTTCGGERTLRKLSVFAAISKSSDGQAHAVSGTGGGCSQCAGGSCSTCRH